MKDQLPRDLIGFELYELTKISRFIAVTAGVDHFRTGIASALSKRIGMVFGSGRLTQRADIWSNRIQFKTNRLCMVIINVGRLGKRLLV